MGGFWQKAGAKGQGLSPLAQLLWLKKTPSFDDPATEGAACSDGTRSEHLCAICFGVPRGGEGKNRCGTCKPDAWTICNKCEAKLVGKPCPVCLSTTYNNHISPMPKRAPKKNRSTSSPEPWFVGFRALQYD